MAFAQFLPAILSGAAAIFSPKPSAPGVERISATGANIPGGGVLESLSQARANATLPYTAGANRTIDFAHGLPSFAQQTPQFVPNAGQSVFNPDYGGGYSGGTQSNYTGNGLFGGAGGPGGGVPPIYGQPYNPVQGYVSGFGGGQGAQGQGSAAGGSPMGQGGQAQQVTPPSLTQNPGATSGIVPGAPNPLTAENTNVSQNGLIAPVGAPGEVFQQNFTPDILRDPFVSGINAAAQSGSFAAQALPGAGAFQAGLYDPGLNQMERNFMSSGAELGLRGLESAFNQIDSQYENTPMAASRGKQRDDAANLFATNMMQQSSQLGLQRQQLATQNLPGAFNQPLQSNQYGQQSAAGLYGLFDNAMRGDLKDQQFIYGNYPVQSDTFIQKQA